MRIKSLSAPIFLFLTPAAAPGATLSSWRDAD
jgi:hypothetical protein